MVVERQSDCYAMSQRAIGGYECQEKQQIGGEGQPSIVRKDDYSR